MSLQRIIVTQTYATKGKCTKYNYLFEPTGAQISNNEEWEVDGLNENDILDDRQSLISVTHTRQGHVDELDATVVEHGRVSCRETRQIEIMWVRQSLEAR